MESPLRTNHRWMRLAAVTLSCLLVIGGAQVLPSPVAAQGTGGPPGGTDCSQLSSALQAAPDLTFFPRIASQAQNCGLSTTQASSPPTCAQLTAAEDAMPGLSSYQGVQHRSQLCSQGQGGPGSGPQGGPGNGQGSGQQGSAGFSDLSGYGWAASAIGQLAQRGIVQGMGNHRFAPGADLTRAQFAALAVRTFKLQAPATPATFTDVQPSDWFYAAVEAAAPYMNVTPGGAFDPNGAITRIAAAAALGAILVSQGTAVDTAQQTQQVWARFTDGGQVPPALAADAATAVTAGLMVGEGSSFGVDAQLDRAQAAVLFLRVLQNGTGTGGGSTPSGSGGTASATCTQSGGSTADCGVPAAWSGTPVSPTAIPLGDGKVSSTPEVGYVDSCTTNFRGGGARHSGPWMDSATNTWDSTTKPAVEGSVSWPQASHSFTLQGDTRVLTTNDLPVGMTTGIFPIQPTDPAYQYDTNPNSIQAQSFSFSVPATPTAAATPSCLGLGPIGVLINGVALFDALDAAGRDAGAHEIQDSCDGHPQSRDIYHYHFISKCIMAQVTAPSSSTLVGYALDGYGIYVERDAQGNLPTNADLGPCHGRTSMVMWDGQERVMYHYDATLEYPYTLGCYHGTPVQTHAGAQPGSPPGPRP